MGYWLDASGVISDMILDMLMQLKHTPLSLFIHNLKCTVYDHVMAISCCLYLLCRMNDRVIFIDACYCHIVWECRRFLSTQNEQ